MSKRELEGSAEEKAINAVMEQTLVRDANKVVVPQYFNSDLGNFVPITKSWGNSGGDGGAEGATIINELEKDVQHLRNVETMLFLGEVDTSNKEFVANITKDFQLIAMREKIDGTDRCSIRLKGRNDTGPVVNFFSQTSNMGWGLSASYVELETSLDIKIFPYREQDEANGIKFNNDTGNLIINNMDSSKSYHIVINAFKDPGPFQTQVSIAVTRYEKLGNGAGDPEK